MRFTTIVVVWEFMVRLGAEWEVEKGLLTVAAHGMTKRKLVFFFQSHKGDPAYCGTKLVARCGQNRIAI